MTMLDNRLEQTPADGFSLAAGEAPPIDELVSSMADTASAGGLAMKTAEADTGLHDVKKVTIPDQELDEIANHITKVAQRPAVVLAGRIVLGPSFEEPSASTRWGARIKMPAVSDPGLPSARRAAIDRIHQAEVTSPDPLAQKILKDIRR